MIFFLNHHHPLKQTKPRNKIRNLFVWIKFVQKKKKNNRKEMKTKENILQLHLVKIIHFIYRFIHWFVVCVWDFICVCVSVVRSAYQSYSFENCKSINEAWLKNKSSWICNWFEAMVLNESKKNNLWFGR